ncbi:polysaccharide pyruvyl transferase family protein [Faecalibacillus intestinalis]|uniref:Polysaccharide pyruvyl transferase family protein n=1 Tax=Faecalibacillus intestinalis TaxID=1982626 RepID=A0AAP2UI64_9FIRM|nr:polysaccharide pyruvyl transferase family protein [Faecalibacillus intestinalis]RGI22768.1 polysaccharide pyruvyl transferase family protein [Coprobacillus sp. OM08-19]MCB8593366.1 polysaccharide pyruvyl transferase family protein [Faecalibacillus intestinalis]MCB8614446.1 polysaccharide pyruvyl transferase family protein [Faecalibacillus intestinalis]MCG4681974.1 polysaccharide pyruvyl transferase family protein [Faecalibacillus intestinalis]MCG4714785.1 polysaccharide pyruvyl transferase 
MIGILTYYNPINYGAVFQAYAMQEIIKTILPNENVGIIEYSPKAINDDYKLIKTMSAKAIIMSFFNYRANRKRKIIFNNFVEQNISLISFNEIDLVSTIILGSDQIWNPNISRGFDPVFFGMLGDDKKRKICSYAASIGVESLTENQKNDLKMKLKNIDYISVRENSAAKIIKELFSFEKKIMVDLDPTLLLKKEQWINLSEKYNHNKPYIFVYSLSGYQETYLTAQKVSKYYDAEIIEVTIKNRKPFIRAKHKVLKTISPNVFLGMIKDAEAIVTDSFHGTVFSLIFNKSMYVVPNKSKGSRMIELLQSVNLESRIIRNVDDDLDYKKIDYEYVEKIMEMNKLNSIKHLVEALTIDSKENREVKDV